MSDFDDQDATTDALAALSGLVGWAYVVLWSASMYPQIYHHWLKKSMRGVSTPYLLAVISGHWCYAIYNFSLYFSADVRDEYMAAHQTHVAGQHVEVPVRVHDVIYAGNGVCISLVLVAQWLVYRQPATPHAHGARGRAVAGVPTHDLGVVLLYVALWLSIAIASLLAHARVVAMGAVLAAIGTCKALISLIKYAPQVTLHRQLQNAEHYSAATMVMDLAGGGCSLLQLLLDAYVHGHADELLANLPKLMLSLVSIWFNAVFLLQRLVLYPNGRPAPLLPLASAASGDSTEAKSAKSASVSSALAALDALHEHGTPSKAPRHLHRHPQRTNRQRRVV